MPDSPHNSRIISLRHVAEAAKVSRMTVSRAFREDGEISDAMREKVLRIADELGYRPNTMVTRMMSGFASRRPVEYHETLAAVWWPQRWSSRRVVSTYSNLLFRGLEEGATRHHCRIEHHILDDDARPGSISRILKARGIRGVILTPPVDPQARIPDLDWAHLSTVAIGSSIAEINFHRVATDHYTSLITALEKVHQHGYRRPCLLLTRSLVERMHRAYTAAFLAWEDGAGTRIYLDNDHSPEELETWLRAKHCDVIIADTRWWLQWIPKSCGNLGYVAMDVEADTGNLTGIRQNTAYIAECAVDQLVNALLRHETGIPDNARILLTAGSWVEGKTMASLNQAEHELWPHAPGATPPFSAFHQATP